MAKYPEALVRKDFYISREDWEEFEYKALVEGWKPKEAVTMLVLNYIKKDSTQDAQ